MKIMIWLFDTEEMVELIVFWSLGYQLLKGLKVGVDTYYNFGNITNTSIAFGYNDQGEMLQYQSRDDRRSDLGGFSFNFGVIFDKKISESLDITASFTYTPQSEIAQKIKINFLQFQLILTK